MILQLELQSHSSPAWAQREVMSLNTWAAVNFASVDTNTFDPDMTQRAATAETVLLKLRQAIFPCTRARTLSGAVLCSAKRDLSEVLGSMGQAVGKRQPTRLELLGSVVTLLCDMGRLRL
ncbi:hypothetical protein ABBQ32_012345 [Trebouxia sp. C0010 RCD-2024]